jgi:hypothetical protein
VPQTRSFLEYNDIAIFVAYKDDDRTVLRLKNLDDNIVELNHYQ